MDIGNLLFESNDVKYNSKDIKNLDINTIFKMESDLLEEISLLEDKSKNLDIIYFNYNKMKNKIKRNIEMKKDTLSKLSQQKDKLTDLDDKKKLLYLTKEYTFYKEQTNTKKLVNKIKNLCNKIDFLKGELRNRKLTLEYNKIKEKYRDIIIFISSEKFDNKKDILPSNLNIDEKIDWFNNRIEEYIEKQVIFDNYIVMLENYYSKVLEKKYQTIN